MSCRLVSIALLLWAVMGCAATSEKMAMSPPKKPEPSPELKKLDRMVGRWSETVQLVSPKPEQPASTSAEGSKEMQTTFAAASKIEWTLGNVFLKAEGWYEMGDDAKVNFVEYWTWDAKAKKYRSWFFNEWGEFAQGTATASADGNTFTMRGSSTLADGSTKRSHGSLILVNNDTMEWTMTMTGPMGKMTIKGVSKRQK